jgi:threonylcarbamoyladenosine tRNA methylthiotransferase MtaB
MRRRYMRQLYKERVELIKTLMPYACIGVDVIVGFPGETEELFLETYNFLNDLPISYLHVFTYSERNNTPANLMSGRVDVSVRKQRNKMLRSLSIKKQRAFYESQLNAEWPVLFETENHDGWMYGYSSNYIRVVAPYNETLINTIVNCRIAGLQPEGFAEVEICESFRTVTA